MKLYLLIQDAEPGNFNKAAPVDLAKRRIRKVKREPTSVGEGANPFTGVALVPQKKEQEAEAVKQDADKKISTDSADGKRPTSAVEVRLCSLSPD